MRNTSTPRLAALFLTAVMAGAWTPNALAQRSYGTNVDNFCVAQGTVAPIQGDCSVCHTGSYGTRVDPEWAWYLNGQSSSNGWINFCGPIATNGPPNGIIASPPSDLGIAVGAAVSFAGSATDPDGDPVSYHWVFPGGSPSSSTAQSPGNVTYPGVGTFTATLVVSDNRGNSDTTPATRVITVQPASIPNTPPNGAITAPASDLTVTQGEVVSFAGLGEDAEGDALSYRWDFGGAAADSSAQNPGPVQLNVLGTFRVTLTVTDSRGAADLTPEARTLTVEPRTTTGTVCRDSDGDQFSPDGGVCGPLDCDDADSATNPGANESCRDGIDNDCDGLTDGADPECDGSDCIGGLINGGGPSLAIQYSQEADRDPASPLDDAVVAGNVYVFVPAVPGIAQVRFSLDGQLRQTENQVPWDFAGGSAAAANPLDTRSLTNGTHEILAEISLDTGQSVAAQAGFVVNNGVAQSVQIDKASWGARERELEVKGPWSRAGAPVTVSNAGTGRVIGTTSVRYDDGRLRYELERSGFAEAPCRVRVEIDGRFGEAAVEKAPADCVGAPPTNRAPMASGDSAATDEDVGVAIPVLANDSDPDGDPLSIVSVGQPSGGSVERVGPAIIYTPAPNWSGVDGFDYRIEDGRGGSATATVSVAVRSVNDPPVATDDAFSTPAGTALTIADAELLANDTDLEDGRPSGIVRFNTDLLGGNATFTRNLDSISVTPSLTFRGTLRIPYRVVDSEGLRSLAVGVVIIKVTPINLTIQRFVASGQLSVRATRSINLALDLRNRSVVSVPAPGFAATLVGAQNGAEVYRETIQVDPAPGLTARYSFPSYKPVASNTIHWTVTLEDADGQPNNDMATRSTTVTP